MSLIASILKKKSSNVLSIYFTSGFPELNDTTKVIEVLSKSGVDFVEVGLPYSDPLADGPTIQDSSQKALKNGMNLDLVFDQLMQIKTTNTTPLVLMGYLNQILKYGEDKFCQRMTDSGIDTLIIPDLPMLVYEEHYQEIFKRYGINHVFLITPLTSDERIRKIDSYTESFIYMVASNTTTGAKGNISKQQIDYFKRIGSMKLRSPLIIGFGISNHHTFIEVCKYANGAIIGSAFIQSLKVNGVKKIPEFIQNITRSIY